MKYSLEERLKIGREIYSHELTVNEAAIKYDINSYTARDYMRYYRDKNNLKPMTENKTILGSKKSEKKIIRFIDYNNLGSLSKEELIDEVIKARVEAERAKKGYKVKGDGQEKEFINLSNMNLK